MLWLFFILLIYLTVCGFFIKRMSYGIAISIGWINVFLAVTVSFWISRSFSLPLVRMLLLVGGLFMAMKTVVYINSGKPLPFYRWICFSWFWVGMTPETFRSRREKIKFPLRAFFIGVLNVIIGYLFILLCQYSLASQFNYFLSWILALIGISLLFHFGLLSFLRIFWLVLGFPVKPLFYFPWRARTLAKFWGFRWNTAFVEMTSASIFKPLWKRTKASKALALMVTFIVSGLFHEIAITLPVQSGFGRPLGYFLLQGISVCLEKYLERRRPDIVKRFGRLWTWLILLLPLPLLFTPAFTDILFFVVSVL